MSPSLPPTTTNIANSSMYTLMPHCAPAEESCRSRCVVGSATLTTDWSITIIDSDPAIVPSTHQRRLDSVIPGTLMAASRSVDRSLPGESPRRPTISHQ
jgi:hypothetical protein